MKVPFRLKRVPEARPTQALLVPGHDNLALLQVCRRLEQTPSPRIFALADGFLLCLSQPLPQTIPGVIRLTEAGPNLLLPVDAELVPGLLADEANALAKKRGLVFLPQDRVLEFDPDRPLPWSEFLQPNLLRSAWQALPEPRRLADTLTEIVYDPPEPNLEHLLDAGGAGIGEEEPRPDDAPLPQKILGQTALGLGKGLAWLGQLLHAKGLAQLGGKVMGFGMSLFPRLGEKLLGKQEAGLRELLRQFREGKVEDALRRALPLTRDPARGGNIYQGTSLPNWDIRYSLGNILGGLGGASIWLANIDIFQELDREYRKQAEAATGRGDFRRAAFIYGKLLGDYRLAAQVLAQGGLHHDAALLYLRILNDYASAARQFEQAGQFDQALQLYRQMNDHLSAGHLLRRLGDEDLAIAEYQQAAEHLIQTGKGHCQAGELMLKHAQRPDLAQTYFQAGWNLRPQISASACARHLAQLHADRRDPKALLHLVTEAEDFYQPPGNEYATSDFFSLVARLGQRPELASLREDLHDRALMMLAHKMRQNSWDSFGAPRLPSLLFSPAYDWPPNVITDATFALQTSLRQLSGTPKPDASVSMTGLVIQGINPTVCAVCQALDSEDIFLGFESGEIARFNPSTSQVQFLEIQPGPIVDMAVTEDGEILVVLSGKRDQPYHLACYAPNFRVQLPIEIREGRWALIHLFTNRSNRNIGLWNGLNGEVQSFDVPQLIPKGKGLFTTDTLFVMPLPSNKSDAFLIFNTYNIIFMPSENPSMQKGYSCAFFADCPPDSLPRVSYRQTSANSLELVTLGKSGLINWLKLNFREDRFESFHVKHFPGSFQAAALVRPGLVAGVDAKGIHYVRFSETRVDKHTSQGVALTDTIACFASQTTQELIVVSSHGSLSRVRPLL